MGTHLRVLSENFLMSTNMTSLNRFQKPLHPCAFDESSLSIGRDKGFKCGFRVLTASARTWPNFFYRYIVPYDDRLSIKNENFVT